MTLQAPVPLVAAHVVAGFESGVASLDDWLRRRALTSQASGAARSFVLCDDDVVVGYYALASGAVMQSVATGRLRRNMPDPVPMVVLARLAIDRRYQKRGIGRALVRDAALRVLAAAGEIGIRGMLVHALSDDARAFYQALGFDPSPLEPYTLMVTLQDLHAASSTL